ncbi:MAG: hypothetical protein O6909_12400 [Alphaproteobacteria bacterium]|nr:hypothetical protein [Alphaproteobacteria bacterium]
MPDQPHLETTEIAPDTPLPPDIRRRIARDFGPADASALLIDIEERCAADPNIFSDRIVRCVVYVANGDLETARRAVSLALIDTRDLIVWAEYDNKFEDQLRDLSAPFD